MYIYKITNQINNKVYIGLTINSIEERWKQHLYSSKVSSRALYVSMRKHGIHNFLIEQIDTAINIKELGNLEMKYIEKFDSKHPNKGYNMTFGGETSAYDSNPKAKLRLRDVVQIREIYAMCELYCKECWEIYKDKISFSAFQKIWEGTTWKGIMDEIYTEETINIHRYIHCKHLRGSNNGFSKFTDEEVLSMRKYYVTHTLEQTHDEYKYKSKSKEGLRSTLNRSYIHLPIYHKLKKYWTLDEEIIDINNYKPVSTISESGE